MLNQDIQKVIIRQQPDVGKHLGINRDFEIKTYNRFATIISGVRRCGKSTFVRQHLKGKKAYYLNFEDIALADFRLEDFPKMQAIFQRLLGSNRIFFFDEIQNIAGWERYVRNLVDARKKVIITGSNASMLSREMGTHLTGRHITRSLYPFTYIEYLRLRKKKHSLDNFKKYLISGGFPEYLRTKDPDVLRNLYQDIFFRDILVRNEIRSESAIRSLLLYLLSNIGKMTSYNKLRRIVGLSSTNTVTQFIEAFENAYLLFSLKKFDYSYKRQLVHPKKIYCIDNAIVSTNAFTFSENKGRLLENLVFLELARKSLDIFYHKEKHECDFVIMDQNKARNLIQVCYELNTDNKKREIAGLVEAMAIHGLKKGMIITFDQEDNEIIDDKKIDIVPAWKWILNSSR